MPQIKKQMSEVSETVQKGIEQVDMKNISAKVQQTIELIKNKIANLKKSNKNNEIAIKINNKEASKQISQLEKEINALQEKINARQIKIEIANGAMDKIQADTMQDVIKDMPNAGNKREKSELYSRLNNNSEYISLEKESDKLNSEIIKYTSLLEVAKEKMAQIKDEAGQLSNTQNKTINLFGGFKNKIEQAKTSISGIKINFNKLPKITQNITNNIKNMGSGLKQGLGSVLKYAGALFSLRGIYSILSSSASSWLSSQNAGAKQLSANIDYMKYAMGSVFAPVIEYIINLVYQLMKAIQSVAYALTGVNIFAKASAKSYASMAGSAKKAKQETQQLAGIHSEINNVQSNNSDSSGGSGSTAPNMDFGNIDSQMSSLAQKIYDFFKPLKESWDNYGAGLVEQIKTTATQIGTLLSSVWRSFENIITNGTVYTTLELILAIIGNIAEAINEAWTKAGIGDKIVQDLFDTFNNILNLINEIAQSVGFQNMLNSILNILDSIILSINNIANAFSNAWNNNGNGDKVLTNISAIFEKLFKTIQDITASQQFQTFLDGLVNTFTGLSEFIKPVVEDLTSLLVPITEISLSIIGTVLNSIGDALNWISQNEIAVSVLEALAIAIGIVTTATTIFTAIKQIETGVLIANAKAWISANLPILLIVVAITAVIAIIILCVKHWEEIKETVSNVCQKIGETVSQWAENIKQWFSNLIEKVKTAWTNFWDNIFDKASTIINNIKTTITTWTENIKNTISNALNTIKTGWSNIWTNIGNTISNVWNTIVNKVKSGVSGAWNAITSVFGNISSWFRDKFSSAWQAVKNVFSSGGAIFDGIKDGILNGLKSVINAIIRGMNKVIAVPLNGLNSALEKIRYVNIAGVSPFGWISTISVPKIPELAKGGVLYNETLVKAGEYSGAKSNPEIVTPQNIMRETFEDVLSGFDFTGDDRPINIDLTLKVSDEKLGRVLLNDLRNMKRQTGQDIEALIGV